MNYLLSEAEEPIRQALKRLLKKNERRLPYVFVEEVVQKNEGIPKAFVQWCTKDGQLLFDVPWAIIRGESVEIDASVILAIKLLRGVGVCDDDRVLIVEDDQRKDDGEPIPFWKRLFA